MKYDSPEKLAAVCLTRHGPSTQFPGKARIRARVREASRRFVCQEYRTGAHHAMTFSSSFRDDAVKALDQQDILILQAKRMVLWYKESTSRGQNQHRRLDSNFVEAIALPVEFREPKGAVSLNCDFRSRAAG